MIIYGSRAKRLGHEQLLDKCPNCESQNTLNLFIFQRYAHIFWIPFVPIGKTGVTHCENCKQMLKYNEMPGNLKQTYLQASSKSKTPLWTFFGIAALAVLIIYLVFDNKKKIALNAQLILSPRAGDVLQYKTKSNNYTLIKVEDVKGDSIFMRVNNYETDKMTGIYKLKSKAYSDEVEGISKKDLKEMFDQGRMLDIERK